VLVLCCALRSAGPRSALTFPRSRSAALALGCALRSAGLRSALTFLRSALSCARAQLRSDILGWGLRGGARGGRGCRARSKDLITLLPYSLKDLITLLPYYLIALKPLLPYYLITL